MHSINHPLRCTIDNFNKLFQKFEFKDKTLAFMFNDDRKAKKIKGK